MELKKYHKHLYTSLSQKLPADGANSSAGSFLVSGKKGCFLLNSEKHPGEHIWGFCLHVKRDDGSERQ